MNHFHCIYGEFMSTLIGYRQKGFVLASLSAATWLLSACGGSGTSTPATPAVPTLQGLAATGAALPGAAVTAKCSSGAPIVGTTAADGSFSLSLSGGQTAPCLLQVVGGTPSVTLHGFATQAGRVNLTPLSDLVVSKALGSDPALAFAAYDAAKGGAIPRLRPLQVAHPQSMC
ncbi:MAG: glucoamylase [Comamonadaceae bacterium]|nr:MAG: glucoamylase [Comamonadaceae bacterium]